VQTGCLRMRPKTTVYWRLDPNHSSTVEKRRFGSASRVGRSTLARICVCLQFPFGPIRIDRAANGLMLSAQMACLADRAQVGCRD
jgi:hypothetical protein